jgi:hypothetical protein
MGIEVLERPASSISRVEHSLYFHEEGGRLFKKLVPLYQTTLHISEDRAFLSIWKIFNELGPVQHLHMIVMEFRTDNLFYSSCKI